MLNVENVTKIYSSNVYANKDISLSLEQGKIAWINGITGSGKTTFLNMLSAVDIPNEGSISWGGDCISIMNEKERAFFRLKNMGLVFQHLELIKTQPAFDNVALPLRYDKVKETLVKEAVREIFDYLNISDLMYKYSRQMSGGQQQRVALARALVHKPLYILGDEISSALDNATAHFIYSKIKQYVKDRAGVALLISHDTTIKDYVDEIYTMKEGEVRKVL